MIEKIEINLLPAEYRIHTKHAVILESVILFPLMAVLVVVLFFGIWSVSLTTSLAIDRQKLTIVDRSIQENKHILDEINALKSQKALVQKKIDALQKISVSRGKWVRLQEVLCQRLPESTWLESVEESNDTLQSDTLHIEGKTFAFPEVATYMSRLSESEYFTNVELKTIDQIGATDGIFKFKLDCRLSSELKPLPAQPVATAAKK